MISPDFKPLLQGEGEQVVFAVAARTLPTLSDVIMMVVFSPTLMLMPWLVIHYLFRRTVYVITTRRVLSIEPKRVVGEIRLNDIVSFRGGRKTLLIRGEKTRLWLSRLPDAWHFETIVQRVIAATGRREEGLQGHADHMSGQTANFLLPSNQ